MTTNNYFERFNKTHHKDIDTEISEQVKWELKEAGQWNLENYLALMEQRTNTK